MHRRGKDIIVATRRTNSKGRRVEEIVGYITPERKKLKADPLPSFGSASGGSRIGSATAKSSKRRSK